MATQLKKLRVESDCYLRPLGSTAIAFVQSNRRDLRCCFGDAPGWYRMLAGLKIRLNLDSVERAVLHGTGTIYQ